MRLFEGRRGGLALAVCVCGDFGFVCFAFLLPCFSVEVDVFDLGAESLLPFVPNVAFVSLFYAAVLEALPSILAADGRVVEILPGFVTTVLHSKNFVLFESIHRDRADKGDMYAEAAVSAGA